MPENRIARNEAWIASLVVHVGLLAGLIAVVGRPRETADGPVVVDTRDRWHEIGVVMLAESPRPATPAIPVKLPPPPPTVRSAPPPVPGVDHAPGPVVPSPVRTVEHWEPAKDPAPTAIRPATHVTATASSPPTTATAPIPLAAAPPLPAGAVTAFFGVPAIGRSVVFVLDRSASMGLDGRLDRARRELAASLRRLPRSARFQVVSYNRTAELVPGSAGLVHAAPEAVEAAIGTVNSLSAEGSSEHGKALTRALSLQPDVIYFLTDEDDLESRDVQAITRINRGRVCIHALCLVRPAGDETPMQALARNNRGEFRLVDW
jgi:hypothetical protein